MNLKTTLDNYCNNCGKYGHNYKKCRDPITSIGIILFKIDDIYYKIFINKYKSFLSGYDCDKYISILTNNSHHVNNLQKVREYKNKIKFLLVRRKHSIGYIGFIRGKYDIHDIESIISLFEQMVYHEIDILTKYDFNKLWNDLWKTVSSEDKYLTEYELAKYKFEELKNTSKYPNLLFYIKNIKPKYDTPEWGFPKGRRNNIERNIDCAKREVFEETGFHSNNYYLLNRLAAQNEIVTGTNDIIYKHIYYTGIINSDKYLFEINNNNEVGDIGWFNYNEAIKLIRPYHYDKIKVLNNILLLIIEIMDNN